MARLPDGYFDHYLYIVCRQNLVTFDCEEGSLRLPLESARELCGKLNIETLVPSPEQFYYIQLKR